jgi:hypothetical protein
MPRLALRPANGCREHGWVAGIGSRCDPRKRSPNRFFTDVECGTGILGNVTTTASAAELRDSSPLLGDSQSLRARIASEGYVFVPGLLDPALVREVGRRTLGHLQAAGWTLAGPDPVTAPPRAPVRAVKMADAFCDGAYRRILADAEFNRIGFESPLADLMGQILGPSGFCYPLKLPRVVYPASLVPRQPGNVVHKDYRSVQDMFTCWVPFGDVPRTLGGLAVLPGSQRSTRLRYRPLDPLEAGWLTTDYTAGDVIVFHCLTTHAALPNREERIRFSGEFRWQLADQPAPRRMVVGPNGNEIGSGLFGRAPWWRPVRGNLTLFEDGGDEGRMRLPAPPSRFVPVDSRRTAGPRRRSERLDR